MGWIKPLMVIFSHIEYIYILRIDDRPNDNLVSKAINHLMVYTNHLWQIWGWHCRFMGTDWMILNEYDPIYLDYYPTYLDVCPRVLVYIYMCSWLLDDHSILLLDLYHMDSYGLFTLYKFHASHGKLMKTEDTWL